MADQQTLADMYHAIMVSFVETGRAPHYIELAVQLGLQPEEARQALHELANSGAAVQLAPDTDYVAVCPPFSNVPTPFKVSVGGDQRWYAN